MAEKNFGCEPQAIRSELQRILSSPEFDASDRNRRFLEYVVEETLAGRDDRIKAYSIATSVFGRGENFDPQQDAIVRIEAGRVRRALEHYYLTSGHGDPIRIAIPTGSYVPTFAAPEAGTLPTRQIAAPAAKDVSRTRYPVHRPAILIVDFEAADGATDNASFAHGFTRHVVVGLTRFTDLAVFGSGTLPRTTAGPDIAALREQTGMDFILTGATALSADKVCVEVLLVDARTGQYIWADYIERPLRSARPFDLRNEVADHVVQTIAQPSGVIFSYNTCQSEAGQPTSAELFESVLRFHRYWRSFDQDQIHEVRLGLERAIVADPSYADAFACLSLTYTNSVRFGYMGGAVTLSPLRRALALAQRAIQLAPRSSRSHLALGIAYWFSGQVSSAFEALETSRALNPNDMEVAAELGLRHALRGNWADGVPLIEEAYGRHPSLPNTYRIGLSLFHFAHGRFDQALSEAWKIEMPDVVYPAIMIAVSAAKLGHDEQARTAMSDLLHLKPDYAENAAQDLRNRNLSPDLIDLIVRGLTEAGLPCGPSLPMLAGNGGAPVSPPRIVGPRHS